MTSVANESVLSDELIEETQEFNTDDEQRKPQNNNLTFSIHMPNLSQLDESKLSFHNKQFFNLNNTSLELFCEKFSETKGSHGSGEKKV